MPYANNEGIRIYYEVEGRGPPLVLHHGRGLSLAWWRHMGYPQALADDYRIILMDARGHGASDKPHDPEAYRRELMVKDVVAVLDDLGIRKSQFFGYSMGGATGWGIAKVVPERFHSLIIGGDAPLDADPDALRSSRQLYRQGMAALLAAVERGFGARWSVELEAIVAANDLEALIAERSLEEAHGLDDVLPTINLPVMVFAGEEAAEYAGCREAMSSMPGATFVFLPELNHIEAIYRIDLVVPHIRQFLAEVGEG